MVFVPESRFSCVLLVSCMHGSDARTRTHTQGQQLRLLFFHLQCPSLPVCLVCCIPRVPNNLGSFSIFCIPHLFVSASFTTQTGSELTKRMQKRTIRSSIPPWSETFARGGFEGTACKRTAKQEPRDKIQLNKWHLFNGHILNVGASFSFGLFYLQHPPPICGFGIRSGISHVCMVFLPNFLPNIWLNFFLPVSRVLRRFVPSGFEAVTS